MYSDFWLIQINYAAQLGSKDEKKMANMIYDLTYNRPSPNKIKIQSTKFFKFLFFRIVLIAVAFAKSFRYKIWIIIN